MTLAAVSAFFRINIGFSAYSGDCAELACTFTGTCNAALTHVRHKKTGRHTALTGYVAYGENGSGRRFTLQSLAGIDFQRSGIILLIFNAKAQRSHTAETDDGPVLIDTAAVIL